MPRETRLLGYGVGSRMTQQPKMQPDGQPEVDEHGVMILQPVLELMFVDQLTGDMIILPLAEEGVTAVQRALNPSGLIVAQGSSIKL